MSRISVLKKYNLPGDMGERWQKKGQARSGGVNYQSAVGLGM